MCLCLLLHIYLFIFKKWSKRTDEQVKSLGWRLIFFLWDLLQCKLLDCIYIYFFFLPKFPWLLFVPLILQMCYWICRDRCNVLLYLWTMLKPNKKRKLSHFSLGSDSTVLITRFLCCWHSLQWDVFFRGCNMKQSVEESITITTSWPELHNIQAWSFNYKGKPDVCNCCYLLYIQNLFSWIWKQLNRGILYSWAQAFCHHLLVQKPLIVGFEVVLIILSIWWEFKACWS